MWTKRLVLCGLVSGFLIVLILLGCDEDPTRPDLEPQQLTVRVTVVYFRCDFADDGWAFPDFETDRFLEMTRFKIWISAYEQCDSVQYGDTLAQDSLVYNWAGDYTMADRNRLYLEKYFFTERPNFIELTFDTASCDLDHASLVLVGFARETDYGSSGDETGWGQQELAGELFFVNNGWHNFHIASSGDFDFYCAFFIEKWE